MLSTSDFGQLRAFVAVGEELSFSRAAASLGVSASALSQMVRGFEERVGLRLLNRTTRSVSLTEAGETLLQRVRPAVVDLGAAVEQVRQSRERPAGRLRVHCFRVAASLFLMPMLRSFTDIYPDIVLDITLDDAVVDMVRGGYDAAIRVGEVIERDMIAVRLGLIFVRWSLPRLITWDATVRRPIHRTLGPQDLKHHRCIRWHWPGHATTHDWEFWDGERWFDVAVDGSLMALLANSGFFRTSGAGRFAMGRVGRGRGGAGIRHGSTWSASTSSVD